MIFLPTGWHCYWWWHYHFYFSFKMPKNCLCHP